jgi:hypothetical protein
MSIAYWIVAGIAAFAFFTSGIIKLTTSRSKLVENKNMVWTKEFTAPQIKLIGLAEVLGAAGLILPHAFSVAENLATYASVGLMILMVGAANTHRQIKQPVYPPLIVGALAFVASFL